MKINQENENKKGENENNIKVFKKRNKIARKACAHCQKSHRKCNDMRPCQNCIKSNKKCYDVENKIKKNVIPPTIVNQDLVTQLSTNQANTIIEKLMRDYDTNKPLVLNDLNKGDEIQNPLSNTNIPTSNANAISSPINAVQKQKNNNAASKRKAPIQNPNITVSVIPPTNQQSKNQILVQAKTQQIEPINNDPNNQNLMLINSNNLLHELHLSPQNKSGTFAQMGKKKKFFHLNIIFFSL
jgi:hypothetical protein